MLEISVSEFLSHLFGGRDKLLVEGFYEVFIYLAPLEAM